MKARLVSIRPRWATFVWTFFASLAITLQPFALSMNVFASSANITSAVLSPASTSVTLNTVKQYTLTFKNSSGGNEVLDAPASVTLTTNSSGGSFADGTSANNPWTANTAIYQTAAAASKAFQYKDSSIGAHTITAVVTGGGLVRPLTATASITVNGPDATLTSTLPNSAITAQATSFSTTITQSANSSPANVRLKITLSDPSQASNVDLEYGQGGNYYPMTFDSNGVTYFGAATGFSLATMTNNFRVTFQKATTYTLTFQIVDATTGAVIGNTLTSAVVVVNLLPDVAITAPTQNAWLKGQATISGTTGSGMTGIKDNQVQAQLTATSADGSSCTTDLVGPAYTATINSDGTWSAPFDTTTYRDGYYCVTANVVGNDGVTYNAQPVFIHIDNTAPKIGGISDGSITQSAQVPFTVQEANLAGVTVDGNGVNCTDNGSGSWSCPSISGEGQHVVVATDQAGNVTTVKFTIDTTAPLLKITATTPNSDGSYTVSGTTSDALSGVASLVGSVDGVSDSVILNNDGTWNMTTPMLASAFSHVVKVVSTDGAGNMTMVQVIIPALTAGAGRGDISLLTPTQPLRVVATTISTSPALFSLPKFSATPNMSQKTVTTPQDSSNPAIQTFSDLKKAPPASSDPTVKILGLVWYWWVIIFAAIGLVWRLFIAGAGKL